MTDKQTAIEHDCKLALIYINGVAINDGDELLAEAAEKLEAALQSKPVDVEALKKPADGGWSESTIYYNDGYNQAIDDMNAKGYLNTPQWQPISTAPRDGAALWVAHYTGLSPYIKVSVLGFSERLKGWFHADGFSGHFPEDDKRVISWKPYTKPQPPEDPQND